MSNVNGQQEGVSWRDLWSFGYVHDKGIYVQGIQLCIEWDEIGKIGTGI